MEGIMLVRQELIRRYESILGHNKDQEGLKLFLQHFMGMKVKINNRICSPLLIAIKINNIQIVRYYTDILEIEITESDKYINRFNCLELAIRNKNSKIMRLLVDYMNGIEVFENELEYKEQLFVHAVISNDLHTFNTLFAVIYFIYLL